jgi:hypothetical protein
MDIFLRETEFAAIIVSYGELDRLIRARVSAGGRKGA